MYFAEERLRVLKLIQYGLLPPKWIDGNWVKLFRVTDEVAFKARVWMLIVNRQAKFITDLDDSVIDLAAYYPKMAAIIRELEGKFIGAYIAFAEANKVLLIKAVIEFSIYSSVLARTMLDRDIVEKLYETVTPDEYGIILNKYFERIGLKGLPEIVISNIMSIQGEHFEDFKKRAYVFSGALLQGGVVVQEAEAYLAGILTTPPPSLQVACSLLG